MYSWTRCRRVAKPAALFLLLIVSACGGGSSGSNTPPPVTPPGALTYPSPQSFDVGVAITPLTPTITGTVTSYAVTPALPSGLSLDATSGRLSGTPTAAVAATDYTITASNSGGSSSFTLSIQVRLQPPKSLSYTSPTPYTVGVAIAALSPSVQGIVTSYSVQPALPAGLSLDASSGVVSGVPTTVTPAGTYTITASNASGTSSFALAIQVLPAPPTGLTYVSPQSYATGVPIAALAPTVQGQVMSYSVSPSLPTGLVIDPATGVIAGTPTAAQSATAYVITASNAGGQSTFSLTITVRLSAPTALVYPSPLMFAVNSPAVTVTPSVQGTVTNFSVTPALPAGLTLDPSTGTLSGTPTAAQAAANYKFTAQNSSGSTTMTASIAVVTVSVTPSFLSRMVASGTPIALNVSLSPVDFAFTGTLYASVTDGTGTVASPVTVTGPTSGAYLMSLRTSTTANLGRYMNTLRLNLCQDAACTQPQPLPGLLIPFDVDVLSNNSSWPGNNLTTLSAWPGVADWTTFQGNASHTGYVDVALDPNKFSTRWQGPMLSTGGLGGSYYPNGMTLTTSNGVFFGANGNTLLARKEYDGSTVWSYDVSGLTNPSTNPPAVAAGRVYMAAGQQGTTYMFSFNAADGSLVFKSPMSSQWEHYLAPTVGPSGVYTDAGSYGGLYGFDTSGNQLFFTSVAMQDEWTPAVDSSYVYAYTGNALTIYDPVSGAQHLQIADPTFQNYIYDIGGSVVLGAAGHAFAAAYDNSILNGCGIGNHLVSFNTTAGIIGWSIAGCYPSTPAYHAGLIYVASQSPVRLEVRSESDGSLQWFWTPPLAADTSFASEVLLTQNMVFVSTNNAIYGIDTSTHQAVWSYPTQGGSRLALSANGVLYLQINGPITAINVK